MCIRDRYISIENAFTSHDVPSDAIKKSHFHILEMARKSLYTQNVKERDFTNTIFSVPVERLPEIKSFIAKTNQEFAEKFGGPSKAHNKIYTFHTSLFSLEASDEASH